MRHEIREDLNYIEEYVNSSFGGDLSLYVSIKYIGKTKKKANIRLLKGLFDMEEMINEIRKRINEEAQ